MGSNPIEHLILLCMENRSFDHYLGALSLPTLNRHDIAGLSDPPRSIPDAEGNGIIQWAFDSAVQPIKPTFPDVPHGRADMLADWNGGRNDGFVKTYRAAHANDDPPLDPVLKDIPMGFYTEKTLPVLYSLASTFTVCDHWHASMLSSTWPNRKYLHSGKRDDDDDTQTIPGLTGFQTTPIYSFLEKQRDRSGIPLNWKCYFSDLPFLAFWYGFAATHALNNFATVESFADDCRENRLPSVSVVDPPFTLADDHPPHDPAMGEKFIALIVDALTNSPSWDTSAMLILYDECGGFYDHVPPPESPAPSDVDRNFGFRVPALLVSPYAKRGFASHTPHDHTAFIKSIQELWHLRLEETSDEFGTRWPLAQSFWDAFDFDQRPLQRGTYTGDPLTGINWGTGVRERLVSPLGKFENMLERIFVLPELKALDRRSSVFDTLGKMEHSVITLKRMQDYTTSTAVNGR